MKANLFTHRNGTPMEHAPIPTMFSVHQPGASRWRANIFDYLLKEICSRMKIKRIARLKDETYENQNVAQRQRIEDYVSGVLRA